MSRPTNSSSTESPGEKAETSTSTTSEAVGLDITDVMSVGVTEGLPPIDRGRPYRWKKQGGIYDVED